MCEDIVRIIGLLFEHLEARLLSFPKLGKAVPEVQSVRLYGPKNCRNREELQKAERQAERKKL